MDIVVATKSAGLRKELPTDGIQTVFVKDNMRSIKKLLQISESKTVFVKENTFIKEKTSKHIKEYKGDITNQTLCIIDKILESTIKEYHLSLPLKEVFVMAEPSLASRIICAIKDKARLFTVVSPFDTLGKMYDELYFKYGTVIRHIPFFTNSDWENSLAVKFEYTDEVRDWIKCPVISFDDAIINDKTLIIRDVCIESTKTKAINEALSIKGGIDSFCILGQMPDGECIVKINEESGKIYTLSEQNDFT